MNTPRMDAILKRLTEACKLIDEEADYNNDLSIREARSHANTALMWITREAAHQEARHG